MEELYKFMNQSNATLDLKVGNELATEALPEGEVAEVHPALWLLYSYIASAKVRIQSHHMLCLT